VQNFLCSPQIIHEQTKQLGIILTSYPKDIDTYIRQLNALSPCSDANSLTSFFAFPESPPSGIDLSVKTVEKCPTTLNASSAEGK
jgi:hypothetical protein